MLAIIHCFFILLLAGWLWKRDSSPLHTLYWPAWIAKVVAGIALGVIYSSYYQTSDTFTFFQLAADRADLARNDLASYIQFLFSKEEGYYLGEQRTEFYIKITSLMAWVTGNNYWITSVYYSFLSFYAAWYLANTISRLFPEYKIAACFAFLFFPSVVFWSSGIIKESLAMAAMFFLTAVFLKRWVNERIPIGLILVSVIGAILIFNLKYYYLAVFIPVTVSALIVQNVGKKFVMENPGKQILLWAGVLACGFFAITFLHPNFSLSRIPQVIAFNNQVFMNVCSPDDVIHFYKLQPTWGSMLINAPWAFISGLFRPFVWEANTIFKFITGVENLMLMILALFTIPNLKKMIRSPHRLLVLTVILYSTILSIFLALSTPNFGTLARYSIGYLPFIVLLAFHQPIITKTFSKLFP